MNSHLLILIWHPSLSLNKIHELSLMNSPYGIVVVLWFYLYRMVPASVVVVLSLI